MNIETIDLAVIIAYLVGIVALGCWAGTRRKDAEGGSYFLAGKSLKWPMIGLALFSTNISTLHLVSLAEQGYNSGLLYGNFEWMAGFTLVILGLFFAPFYFRSNVTTLPDFLERRYNRACRDWLAYLSIVSAVFIHIGFTLYTGAVVFKGIFGLGDVFIINIAGRAFQMDMCLLIAIVVAGLTGLYTIIGGLLAVVLTESLQTIVLIIGALCVTGYGFHYVGGWSGLTGSVEPLQMTMLRTYSEAPDLPWYSVFLGYPIIGIWYWCTDQTIVQRVLGAKNENHARIGPIFAGFIKILPVFIFILPGMMCLALINQGRIDPLPVAAVKTEATQTVVIPEGHAAATVYNMVKASKQGKVDFQDIVDQTHLPPGEVRSTLDSLVKSEALVVKTGETYTHLLTNLLPKGLKGLVAAALLAALMSTVSGALNSIATLFSYDIFKRYKPNTTDKKLVFIGRIATFIAMIAAVAWSPLISHFESIFVGINTMITYIAPPITAVFLGGIFWRRASSFGARAALYIGSLIGLCLFFIGWYHKNEDLFAWLYDKMPALGGLWRAWQGYGKIPFMMPPFFLFLFCLAVLIVGSLWKPHAHSEASIKLVWDHPLACLRDPGWKGIGNYKFLSILLIVVMVVLYWIFR